MTLLSDLKKQIDYINNILPQEDKLSLIGTYFGKYKVVQGKHDITIFNTIPKVTMQLEIFINGLNQGMALKSK